MKSFSVGLSAHVALGQTTLTTVLTILRRDGVEICVTEHDQNLVFTTGIQATMNARNLLHGIGHSVTALSYAGFSKFNLQDKSNLDTTNIQVEGMIDASIFTRADILARRFDYADVQVFMVNWKDLTQADGILLTGRTGTWTIEEFGFKTNFYGLAKQLDDVGGEICGPTCRVDFGSSRCAPAGTLADGTTIDSLMQSGTVSATDGKRTLTAPFSAGGVILTSVLNAGGTGYAPGDTGIVGGGNADAVYAVDTVGGGGAVLTYHLTAPGTGYSAATGVSTGVSTGAGDGGFTVNITVSPANGITDIGKPVNGGLITWTGGNNSGLSQEAKVVDTATGEITLYLQALLTIQVGDTFKFMSACDHTVGVGGCGAYQNILNFQGEPYAPGPDYELNYPDWHAPRA